MKYCSRACRDKARTTGWSMGSYTCAFCGKTVERRLKDALIQKHCSRSCALRSRAADVVTPEVPDSFGYWLSGLIDGEGTFTVVASQTRSSTRFAISLRRDDKPLLEKIAATLGFGKVYDQTPRQKMKDGIRDVNPKSVYFCNSLKECMALVAVLKRFPLQSKKARDFAIWVEAIDRMAAGENGIAVLPDFQSRLQAIRQYTDPSPP